MGIHHSYVLCSLYSVCYAISTPTIHFSFVFFSLSLSVWVFLPLSYISCILVAFLHELFFSRFPILLFSPALSFGLSLYVCIFFFLPLYSLLHGKYTFYCFGFTKLLSLISSFLLYFFLPFSLAVAIRMYCIICARRMKKRRGWAKKMKEFELDSEMLCMCSDERKERICLHFGWSLTKEPTKHRKKTRKNDESKTSERMSERNEHKKARTHKMIWKEKKEAKKNIGTKLHLLFICAFFVVAVACGFLTIFSLFRTFVHS